MLFLLTAKREWPTAPRTTLDTYLQGALETPRNVGFIIFWQYGILIGVLLDILVFVWTVQRV